MDAINAMLENINDFMYTYILVFALAATGIYFTVRTKFVQFRLLKQALKAVTEKATNSNQISAFQALMISTASRVGTGNIVGVSAAVAVGGPGAIFWMWIMALLGGASAFIESTLAQIYKRKDGPNAFRGGPAYYIQQGMKCRPLGIVFGILLILCTGIGWNSLTAFNIGSSLELYIPGYYDGFAPVIVGVVIAILTALVIFGGVHRIGFVSSVMVPIMAGIYIIMAIIAICMNIGALPGVLSMIVKDAFDLSAVAGGFAGSCIVQGVKRGLFSNEAGMGTGAYAAATADVPHPVTQGLGQILSVFLDTLFICSATAMFLLLSDLPIGELSGTPYIQAAAKNIFGELGIHFVTISLFLFAFSTIIGNYYYAEANVKFIKDSKTAVFVFRIIQILIVFFGAQLSFDLAWNLADVSMGLVAIVNIVALAFLGNIALKALKHFDEQRRTGKSVTFKASDIGLDNTECWK